jgi:predicted LPLAT superfamily acyltransferase
LCEQSSIRRCGKLFALATWAIQHFGDLLFPHYAKQAPFLQENYLDFFLGGVDDNAMWTSW